MDHFVALNVQLDIYIIKNWMLQQNMNDIICYNRYMVTRTITKGQSSQHHPHIIYCKSF
jgi:hypothetical protein